MVVYSLSIMADCYETSYLLKVKQYMHVLVWLYGVCWSMAVWFHPWLLLLVDQQMLCVSVLCVIMGGVVHCDLIIVCLHVCSLVFVRRLVQVRICWKVGSLRPLFMLQVQFATEVTLIRLLDYACIILIEDAIG